MKFLEIQLNWKQFKIHAFSSENVDIFCGRLEHQPIAAKTPIWQASDSSNSI